MDSKASKTSKKAAKKALTNNIQYGYQGFREKAAKKAAKSELIKTIQMASETSKKAAKKAAKKAEKSQLTNIQEAPKPVLTMGEMETEGARYCKDCGMRLKTEAKKDTNHFKHCVARKVGGGKKVSWYKWGK
ncbi:hypothetical protein CASFOL_016196 [Castilleja foliolosa]|uniref:Uncharacterized protein n=1 Tax=Castilleja foliolosa TaxID=1961234 RepID=A0ABD3DG83_9LAMI